MSNTNREQAISYHQALLAELKYYKVTVLEQQDIIKQLTEGPGEVEYIHPLDLAHILNSCPTDSIIDLYKNYDINCISIGSANAGRKIYIQSVHIPAKHKEII